MQHLVHRHGQGVLVAQDHHPQRIADEDAIDAGLVLSQRGGIVVRGQHGNDFATFLLLTKRGGRDLFPLRRGRRGQLPMAKAGAVVDMVPSG